MESGTATTPTTIPASASARQSVPPYPSRSTARSAPAGMVASDGGAEEGVYRVRAKWGSVRWSLLRCLPGAQLSHALQSWRPARMVMLFDPFHRLTAFPGNLVSHGAGWILVRPW